MSAMTGPRSPTSPWPRESQTLALPGCSSPTALFPLSDPRPSFNKISPRGAATELPESNYFSFNAEGSNTKNREHISRTFPFESAEGKLISGKDIAGPQAYPFGPRSGGAVGVPDPTVYKLSLNHPLERGELKPGGTKIVPAQAAGTRVNPVSTENCADLVDSHADDLMLLDVRPYAHFSKGNIKGALNLCIPTTLLKRPSFDTKKLANTFTDETDRRNFGRWRQCRYIVVYDASTSNMKDAAPLANVLKKFSAEGWNGDGMVLMGGFRAFSSRFPELTHQQRALNIQSAQSSPIHIELPQSAPIAGGCSIPESSNVAIPFFGNIRQHMDLVGGVGQIALKHSEHLSGSQRQSLPPWLREISDPADQGRIASSRFFEIEKTELERMKQALSYDQNNDPSLDRVYSPSYRVAGIEKGTKNRYNDIYPYDHSRVKLQDIPYGDCDYVNASFMKAEYSDRHYIATQAPIPDTFDDFWRVVWEQDVRLVVTLTAEVERGQVKCHPYWKSGTYGPFYVNNFSKKLIPMESSSSQVGSIVEKPSVDSTDNPNLVIRHFGLSHSGFPFEPLREITQLQYADWPDFGTISQPRHLLDLIEQCDKVLSTTSNAAPDNPKRPVLVHCSAGCGRTGTFCTVDSVLDVLKRQRAQASGQHEGRSFDSLLGGGQLDLVAKTLSEFRTQRPSVVQNLSQFVLCYESVLEWFVTQMPQNPG
ncbi:protein-tyrosine phosphatase-like protein [Aspergillus aurantiobrunneus]